MVGMEGWVGYWWPTKYDMAQTLSDHVGTTDEDLNRISHCGIKDMAFLKLTKGLVSHEIILSNI